MNRRTLALLLALAALSTAASHARADMNGRRLSRLWSQPKAVPRALLTDEGKIPMMVRLPPGVRADQRGLLPVAPGYGSILLTPEELSVYGATYPDVVPWIAPPRRLLIDYASIRWTRVRQVSAETGLDGSGVVVGIVDTGLDAAHPDFLDEAGRTRVAWLMQRQEPRGLHPELEAQYGCGSESQSPCAIYSAADIDHLLATDPAAAPRDQDGHGTHVASLAVGNGGVSIPGYFPAYAGVARKATVIVASPSSGGGFRDPDIVRAVRFVFDRADELGMPAVVNVSLGSDFGPHDGTGALEQGLAALVQGEPGRVIVVAAGNSGELYEISGNDYGIHTEAHVSPNAVTRVPIAQPGANGLIDGAGFVWVNFRPDDEVSVGLEGPDGADWIDLVSPGDEAGHNDDDISAGVVNNLVNGKTALTEQTNGAVVFWDGSWEAGELAILLRGRGDAQLWVTGTGGAGPSAASIGLTFVSAVKQGTVAVPASHPELIAVGCTLNRSDWPIPGASVPLPSFGSLVPPIEDSVCYFSGAGPTPDGSMKPDLLAPGAFVIGAMSRDADPRIDPQSIFYTILCQDGNVCTVADDWHAITAGTSMSAPQVAGAAALLLQRDPNLTQSEVREILQAGARRPRGVVPYDYQQGPGTLDLVGALQVLEERAGSGGLAEPAASFYVLAAPYLRPDPDWPVEVVVQMRHADGTIATDLAATDFTIVTEGGLIAEPFQRMRAGTWSFGLAAPRGSGGTFVTLDVRYRGQSLGVHTIPVGVDAWAAGQGVEAVGGCSVGGGPGGGPARSSELAWLIALLCLAARRRRLTSERATGSTRAWSRRPAHRARSCSEAAR